MTFNGVDVPVVNFDSYIKLFVPQQTEICTEKVNDLWEISVAVSDGYFQQVSFVNSIATTGTYLIL